MIIKQISNKIFLRIVLFLVIGIFVSCSSVNIEDTINGGFEESDYDGEFPDGWFANNFSQTKKHAELLVDNSVAHSGDRSILISISKDHPPEIIIYNWIRRVDGLIVGETYELQGWVKTEKIKNSPFLDVQCWNNVKIIGSASTIKSNSVSGTKNWQFIKTIFNVPKSTLKILIRAGIKSSGNNGGKVWFDDIQISKAG